MQNMGEHALSKTAKEVATRLGKDTKNHTVKSFRRSTAKQIVEAGMSVACLQMAGNWKVVPTPLEHVEHSNKHFKDRMSMQDGEEADTRTKKQKVNNNE